MSVQPEFDSVSEADAAYYGSNDTNGSDDGSSDGGDTSGGDSTWGELQVEPTEWVAGWTLAYQPEQGGGPRRWFVFRVNPETEEFEALNMQGQASSYPEDASMEELPHTTREQEARDAYQTWLDENGSRQDQGEDGEGGDGGTTWGEWQQLNQVAGWTVWGREAQNSDQVQFLAAGETSDGKAVYLQSDGTMGSEPEIYNSQSALQEALDAWQSRVQNGEVPEGQRPTGNSPSRDRVAQDARGAGADRQGRGQITGPLAGAVQAVGGRRNAMILGTVALIGGLYLAESYGYLDLGLQDVIDDATGAVQHG